MSIPDKAWSADPQTLSVKTLEEMLEATDPQFFPHIHKRTAAELARRQKGQA